MPLLFALPADPLTQGKVCLGSAPAFIGVSLCYVFGADLGVDQLTPGITRLTLEAPANPELSPKVGNLIDGFLWVASRG